MKKSKPTCSISILKGRVYMFAKRPKMVRRAELAECVSLLGAGLVEELGATVTHVVTKDGTVSAAVQKKIAALTKKGASIDVVSEGDVYDHVRLEPQLVGELVAGNDGDHALLEELLKAYPYGVADLELIDMDLQGLAWKSSAWNSLALKGVNLAKAVMPNAGLSEAKKSNLDGANLRGGYLFGPADCTFRDADLQGIMLMGTCVGSNFDGANLKGARIDLRTDKQRPADAPTLRSCQLDGAIWTRCTLTVLDCTGSTLRRSEWDRCEVPGVILRDCDLSESVIDHSDFTGGNLSGAKLCRARLTGVNLTGVELTGADFTGAALMEVTLDPGLDVSSIQGLSEALSGVTRPSKALSALDAAVDEGNVELTVHVAPGPQDHGHEGPDGLEGENFVLSLELSGELPDRHVYCRLWAPDGRTDRGPAAGLLEGFKNAATFAASGQVLLESVVCKVRKAKHTGAEIGDLFAAALAEAFGQAMPDAKKLKASTKAYRAALKASRAAKSAENAAEMETFLAEEAMREEAAAKAAEAERAARPEPTRPAADFETFVEALEVRAQASRVKSAKKMLQGSGFQLFHDATDPGKVTGVIKSQTDDKLVYACKLGADGHFTCCTQNLRPCGGLRGALCKHQLVLLMGLVKEGVLDAAKMDLWVKKSLDQEPALDKDEMSEPLLRYKGAEAGDNDWRPTETIPEDFYAF